MPPPIIPPAASGLAKVVSDTVIEITQRQNTPVSQSDVTRGVHKAIATGGLSVVDYTMPKVLCDLAHGAPFADKVGHTTGFCKACAAIYFAGMRALEKFDEVEGT